jgi:hypothetical protein
MRLCPTSANVLGDNAAVDFSGRRILQRRNLDAARLEFGHDIADDLVQEKVGDRVQG